MIKNTKFKWKTTLFANNTSHFLIFLFFFTANSLVAHDVDTRKPAPLSCCTPSVSASSESASSIIDVSGGGTGFATATTAYSLIAAGISATGAFQHVDPTAASNTIVVSNGTGALPSFKTLTPVVTVLTTASVSPWVPTTGMVMTQVECVGAGGGSGGASFGAFKASGGGGGGAYSRKLISAATMAAGTKTFTVGAGGLAGAAFGGTGGTGGTTTFGATTTSCIAPGGLGSTAAVVSFVAGGAGGAAGTGDLAISGNQGDGSIPTVASGAGGDSIYGAGGAATEIATGTSTNGSVYGGGAGGLCNSGAEAGGTGGNGVIIMTEWILS